MKMQAFRRDYQAPRLLEEEVANDPFVQFRAWFEQAAETEESEPNAMTLATASAQGRPSARILLMKDFDERGLVFYTNYGSRKGLELAANPWASTLFFWPRCHRQVRFEGRIEKVSSEDSDRYFAERPRDARLGAWGSRQSTPVESRAALDDARQAAAARFDEKDPVPRPEYWGGYRLVPDTVEFWQGQPSRFHDRLVYARSDAGWTLQRLMP